MRHRAISASRHLLLATGVAVGLSTALSAPRFAEADTASDEAQAILDLMTVVEAENAYAAANCGFFAHVSNLCWAGDGTCTGIGIPNVLYGTPAFISPELGRSTPFLTAGYVKNFEWGLSPVGIPVQCDPTSTTFYCFNAAPETVGGGARSFAAASNGVLYYDSTGVTIPCPIPSGTPVLGLPALSIPTPASTLTGATVSAQWSRNDVPVTAWWIYAGSSPGASNYFDSGSLGANTTGVLSGLPTDGSTVHVRLWFLIAGKWKFTDSQYTAANLGAAPPSLTSPLPGSTLSGSSQTFQWSPNGTLVSEWWLYLGSSPGSRDLFDSGPLGASNSVDVSSLPVDGSTLYVRLWYRNGGPWLFVDSTLTAHTAAAGAPDVLSPLPGSTYSSSSELFQWTANGAPVSQWWLYAGSSTGANDFFDSGSLGAATSVTVTGLPFDGRSVSVRLWYRIAGSWLSRDFLYSAPTLSSMMTAPLPGSILPGSSLLFQWNPNGQTITEWWFYVGSSPGGTQYFNSGSLGTSLSGTATGLPTSGGNIYFRLWFRVGGVWKYSDFLYLAAGS